MKYGENNYSETACNAHQMKKKTTKKHEYASILM